MKSNLIFFILCVIFLGCKNSTQETTHTSSIIISEDANKSKENEQNTLKENKVDEDEFLRYIDEDMLYQPYAENDNTLEAWTCKISNNIVEFSGKVLVTNLSSNDMNMINKLNEMDIKNIHNNYDLYAIITHKEYFLPFESHIDNPCEYYKDKVIQAIYISKKGSQNWILLEEKSKEEISISQLLQKT